MDTAAASARPAELPDVDSLPDLGYASAMRTAHYVFLCLLALAGAVGLLASLLGDVLWRR